MGNVLGSLKPQPVWDIFEELCQYPHPSKKEEKIAAFIMEFAKRNNIEAFKDSFGNVILKKPATPGMENRKPIVIQGHIDMVCEKNNDVEFDFDNDPIQLEIDGDWVKAKGTTLGADNGIGVAMGLAALISDDVAHPPLEVLCTLDEETGLTGATNLATDVLNGEIMLNLDSEEDGAFTIGCAGGQNTEGTFKIVKAAVPADSSAYTLAIRGLRGGHSGIEIHDGRANAIKLLNRLLWNFDRKFNVRLSSLNSGSKHNAIPREAFAVITVPKNKEQELNAQIQECLTTLKSEYATKEPDLTIVFEPAPMPAQVFDHDFQVKFFNTLYAMPHGVIRMSPDIAGLVQTSTNLAIVQTLDDEVKILTSQRSSAETEKKDVVHMVESVLLLGGAKVEFGDGYPGWQPNINSPILKTAINVYKEKYGKEPKVEAIHAGLECGLIGEKYPKMDMISFGPTLKDVHSPAERVQISTVGNCWNLLKDMLNHIPVKD